MNRLMLYDLNEMAISRRILFTQILHVNMLDPNDVSSGENTKLT